jgi:hypothetical protein
MPQSLAPIMQAAAAAALFVAIFQEPLITGYERMVLSWEAAGDMSHVA